jgi:hypothetical protein
VAPTLTRAGGFRLDDPAGEVGLEFIFVTDDVDGETTYHVPLAYRGAPLPDAEEGLLGTSEHGALRSLETTVLLSVEDTIAALRAAQSIAYRAPGAQRTARTP